MENQNNPSSFPPPPGNPFMNNPMGGGQMNLPNATAILVLGIISIATCWCYGVIGATCGIIALVMAGKSMKLYKENPNAYTLKSYNNAKAGRICAIIGTILSGLYVVYIICLFAIFGAALTSMPWQSMNGY
jgi:hypothetical protein